MLDRYPRSLRPPRDSFFLFGMRGVGKSTWARQHFPSAPGFDLLDEGRYQWRARPSASHLGGLNAIGDLPGVRRRLLVHLGPRAFRTEDGGTGCRRLSSRAWSLPANSDRGAVTAR